MIKWNVLKWPLISLVIPLFAFLELKPEFAIPSQQETGSAIQPPISSNWVATDALGRTLPDYRETGGFRRNKYVGIFYFLWHGYYDNNKDLDDKIIHNTSVITKGNPVNPKFGPEGVFHWWGEPEVGYFKSSDPWVIRRNLQLLTEAGVDILFLDTTNGDVYLSVVNKICEIALSMRKSGIPTPYICFVNFWKTGQNVSVIYEQFYAKNLYPDLWFRWQGKPLMLGKIEEIKDPTMRNFFTWRDSQGWDEKTATQPHHWQWLDFSPQDYGWDNNPAIPEQIPVGVATHPFSRQPFVQGKSFHGGREPVNTPQGTTDYTDQGLYFNEQWQRALHVNPSVVFVTGWNEWIAQRFINREPDSVSRKNAMILIGKPIKYNQTYFYDSYNQEYNRDIDPMKGGYTDNYYYQLVANIRRYKGMAAPVAPSPAQTIRIDGQFAEWSTVLPFFSDPPGDTMHRNWPRADDKMNYVNNTGRNDIVFSRVAYDAKNVYFYAKTASKLTPSTGKNWMLLYIDTDQSAKTGWAGYDYLINQQIKGNTTSISKWTGKAWKPVATCSFRYTNNELEISIPLAAIRQKAGQVKLDFHWADNVQQLNDITQFFLNGDSAPDRRFNYRYNSK